MCKYNKYQIRVTFKSGDSEIITMKGMDTSSYKSMMDTYKEVKREYEESASEITFFGISKEGELGVIFKKENHNKESERLLESTRDIAERIQRDLETLHKKISYHKEMVDTETKKADVFKHKIESLKFKKFKNEYQKTCEKIKIFDGYEQALDSRRYHKDETVDLNFISKKVDLLKISNNFNINKKPSFEYIEEDTLIKHKILETVRYKNEQEKNEIIKRMKGKYGKIKDDKVSYMLTFYNKAR